MISRPAFSPSAAALRKSASRHGGRCDGQHGQGVWSPVLRNLWDPVRSLGEAIEDMTAKLKAEFDAPYTSRLRRAQIIERLAVLNSVLSPTPSPASPRRQQQRRSGTVVLLRADPIP